jgi:hypothetical protein
MASLRLPRPDCRAAFRKPFSGRASPALPRRCSIRARNLVPTALTALALGIAACSGDAPMGPDDEARFAKGGKERRR